MLSTQPADACRPSVLRRFLMALLITLTALVVASMTLWGTGP
jgi:hypothetical protein